MLRDVAGAIVGAGDLVERLLRHAGIDITQFARQPVVLQQVGARLDAEARAIERGSLGERVRAADGVQAAEEAPDPLQHIGIVEQRCATTAARKRREAKSAKRVERATRQGQRRHRRDLGRGQFGHERMLLEDLRVAPAAGAVELGDDEPGAAVDVLDARLEHAVLVAVECEQRARGHEPDAVQRIQHHVGRQAGVRRLCVGA